MKCHKCANLIKDYSATETDKTFLYKCRMNVVLALRYGLGETKP